MNYFPITYTDKIQFNKLTINIFKLSSLRFVFLLEGIKRKGYVNWVRAPLLTDPWVLIHLGAVLLNGDVKVTSADGTASNGVIHGVDSVLIPPSMMRKIEKSMTSTKPHLKGRNGD